MKERKFLENRVIPFAFNLKPGHDDLSFCLVYQEKTEDNIVMFDYNQYFFMNEDFENSEQSALMQKYYVGLGLDFSARLLNASAKIGLNGGYNIEYNEDRNKKLKKHVDMVTLVKTKVSLDPNEIKVKPEIEKKIRNILNSGNSKQKIKEELFHFFLKYGYYVPLEIYYGGKFIHEFNSSSINNSDKSASYFNASVEANLKWSSKEKNPKADFGSPNSTQINFGNDPFQEVKIDIKGGNIVNFNGSLSSIFCQWIYTLNDSNITEVGFDNVHPIHDFFSSDLKNEFLDYKNVIFEMMENPNINYASGQDFLDHLKTRYYSCDLSADAGNKEKKYKDIYDPLKGMRKPFEWSCGVTEQGYNLVLYKKLEAKKSGQLLTWKTDEIKGSLDKDEVCVGWKVVGRWHDGTNGTWKCIDNPLFKSSYDFVFESQTNRGMSFWLYIYYIKV